MTKQNLPQRSCGVRRSLLSQAAVLSEELQGLEIRDEQALAGPQIKLMHPKLPGIGGIRRTMSTTKTQLKGQELWDARNASGVVVLQGWILSFPQLKVHQLAEKDVAPDFPVELSDPDFLSAKCSLTQVSSRWHPKFQTWTLLTACNHHIYSTNTLREKTMLTACSERMSCL